jgi:hypothetical protein
LFIRAVFGFCYKTTEINKKGMIAMQDILGIMKDILNFILHPTGWVFCSGLFFWFIVKKSKPAKTAFYLKCYCILMMPLAIQTLIKAMSYVSYVWGDAKGNTILFFLIMICIE